MLSFQWVSTITQSSQFLKKEDCDIQVLNSPSLIRALIYGILFSSSSLELLSTSTNLQTVNVNTFLQSHLTVLLVYCILWFSKLGLKKTTFGNGSFPGGLYLMGFILKMAFGNINYTQNTFKVTTILLKYALSWNIVFEKWNGICEHFLIL